MKNALKIFLERLLGSRDEDGARKCPCCSREMSYFPHLPVANGQGVTPQFARWCCIFCGR